MKHFDYIIGNPPYQEEKSEVPSESNGQTPRTNIFQHFQKEADKIATESSVMIYPGGRWIHQFGKGLRNFGHQQINDKTLQSVDFYPDAKEIFGQSADLSDGVTIVVKKKGKTTNGFDYIYHENGEVTSIKVANPGDELIPLNPKDFTILEKVEACICKRKLGRMHDRVLPRTLFGIESEFVENNPEAARLYQDSKDFDPGKEVKVLTNDKAGKAGRAKWYVIDKQYLAGKENYIKEWQVAVSSANAGGQKRDNQIEIIDNHSAFGRVRVALASFKTKKEAVNFYNYCHATLVRYLFLMTDESLTSLGKRVIDIMDYSDGSIVDFTEPLDSQLYEMVGLSKKEQEYIQSIIDEIDRKRGKETTHD